MKNLTKEENELLAKIDKDILNYNNLKELLETLTVEEILVMIKWLNYYHSDKYFIPDDEDYDNYDNIIVKSIVLDGYVTEQAIEAFSNVNNVANTIAAWKLLNELN